MGIQPPGPVKSRQARERYLKRRRREQALMVAGTIVGCIAVVIIIGAVLLLRACTGCSCSMNQPPFVRDTANPGWAQEVATHNFRPAPWFYQLDENCLYFATDNQLREFSYLSLPVDTIGAQPFAAAAKGWQLPVDAEFSSFALGGGQLAGFRQYFSDPPHVLLTSYNADGSGTDWSLQLDDASGGCTTTEGKVMVVGYTLPDGDRLAGYNLMTQAKAWGMKLPLRGLFAEQSGTEPLPELSLFSVGNGVVAYQKFNIVGLVDVGSGQRNEFAASAFVWDIEPDSDARICYLLVAGNQLGTYKVRALPFSEGVGHDVYRFECKAPVQQISMYATGGNLLLSYPVGGGDSNAKTRLLMFQGTSTEAVLTHEFDGLLQAVASLTTGQGEFVLAFNSAVDDGGLPTGRGALHRVRVGDGIVDNVWDGPRFSRPILGLAPLKEDCLVLLRGGEIWSYGAAANGKRRLRKARYPLLEPVWSEGGTTLAVLSYTEAYLEGRPGQQMQVIVYK